MKDIEKKLENLYTKLGKAYYEGRFEDPLPELLPLFDAITELKCSQEQTDEKAFCPQCGNELKGQAIFCCKCGCRIG